MNMGTDGPRSEVNPFDVLDALKNRMASGHSLEPEVSTETYINDDEDQPIHPLHKPEEGSYVCPVKGCSQVIKTMKGVLGHMRIKHKREYVIFRRTKMATAHRKCDECEFWFQSAKTYHQHRSQVDLFFYFNSHGTSWPKMAKDTDIMHITNAISNLVF